MEDQKPSQAPMAHGNPLPVLNHRTEFESLLANYAMSPEASQTLNDTPFVLMVSVTAAGRNTIIERLLHTNKYYFIVSDTTRPIRTKDGLPIEQHGVQYFFRPEEDILEDVRNGKFIEAAIIHNQQVSGVSIREVEKARSSSKIAITDIEVQGCESIMRVKPDAIPIFILPPSFGEWLQRINKRSNLSDEELKNRLHTAINELSIALTDDRFAFVINDQLDDAIAAVDSIAHGGPRYNHHNVRAREIAEALREQAKSYLIDKSWHS